MQPAAVIPMEERDEYEAWKDGKGPTLHKQCIEFVIGLIKESFVAASLVDLGCRSKGLLECLISNPPASLERIAGVDCSRKNLDKIAQSLSSSNLLEGLSSIKSVVLYQGNIKNLDPQLFEEFDIATCLEVVEHMEEEKTGWFGDLVLSFLAPKMFIISTPNYDDYNGVRNSDHKFEWSTIQFEKWASDLAKKHNYEVELKGVVSDSTCGLGFATNVAVFRKTPESQSMLTKHKKIWKWSNEEASSIVSRESEHAY